MNFFDAASDLFTRPLDSSLAAACADARALVELLNVDSYAKMGHLSPEQAERLHALENRLQTALARPPVLAKETPWAAADWEAAFAFAQAYRLTILYPDTVGTEGEIIATLPTPSFSVVRPPHEDPVTHAAIFAGLCERIGLDAADRETIETQAQTAAGKLARRRQLVALLRAELRPDPARPPISADAHRFFSALFPDHPLQPGEVEVLATESCVYFCILSNDAFAKTEGFLARDEAARKTTLDYLERLRRFNFYNFSHFPAFTSFEAREMDPAHLDRLVGAMNTGMGQAGENAPGKMPRAAGETPALPGKTGGRQNENAPGGMPARPGKKDGRQDDMDRAGLIALLNTAVFIEERDNLEKYLVHDSWGHYWQADLTNLGTLYDRMASLQLPLAPSDTARVGDKLCTFLDLVYLRRDGTLLFDETLAWRFAAAWMYERFQPLLAPIIAELAADMIEYRARTACRAQGIDLPSSSLFPHHPAKIDFAWADLSFFVKSLKRVNTLYAKDEELKAGFVERARLLFRLKYRRNFPAVASAEKLDAELKVVLERLLAIFNEVQETYLGIKLEIDEDAEGRPHPNAFFQVFLNLLQIGMTLNGIIHGQLEGERPHLAPHFQTLIIFVVKYFERDPLRGFWTLDEILAEYAVPLLEALAAAEKQVPGKMPGTAGETPTLPGNPEVFVNTTSKI